MLKKLKNIFSSPAKQLKKMSKKKKICVTAGVILIIVAAAFIMNAKSKRNDMKSAMNSAFTTETAKIERQTLSNSISATGTVASAETKTVNTSLKDLEVVAVYVKEGDYVEAGTIICEFDSSDYEESLAEAEHNASINAKLEALEDANSSNESVDNAYKSLKKTAKSKDEAKSDYQDAESTYNSAKSTLSSASSKLQSTKAAYEAIADELDATPAALNTYKTAYETALNTLANEQIKLAEEEAELEKLKASSASSSDITAQESVVEGKKNDVKSAQDTVDTKKAAYDVASTRYNELKSIKSAYEAAQTAYNSANASLSSAQKALEQAENTLEQTKEQLDSAWETYDDAVEKADFQSEKEALQDQLISESQEDKAIDQYTELIDDCVVTASMSGVITSLNVTQGNVFEGGDVYTIQDNEHFIVTSSVDEYDISSIKKGMPAYIKTDATGDIEMTGEVTYVAIAPSGNGAMGAVSSSASYTIKVSIDNADENLRAGMTAKISISLEESADTLTVPYDAVTVQPDGTASITVDMNGEKKTITVQTGLETDYYTEIISDEISEGMTVYLSTPMVNNLPDISNDSEDSSGMFNITMPGGNGGGGGMPSGGGNRGGGMPSGGGPGGF